MNKTEVAGLDLSPQTGIKDIAQLFFLSKSNLNFLFLFPILPS